MAETQLYCTFYLGKHFFGVEVEKVREILRYQNITRMPLAPPAIRGLINLRGQIVTAVDLGLLLGLLNTGNRENQLPINVVVRTDAGEASLLVDEIGDVQEVGQESFEEVPETLEGIARELIRGVHKLKNQLLLVLDTEKTLQRASDHGNGVQKGNYLPVADLPPTGESPTAASTEEGDHASEAN